MNQYSSESTHLKSPMKLRWPPKCEIAGADKTILFAENPRNMIPQNPYESHIDLAVSATSANFRDMSNEQLIAVLDDDAKLESIILNLPQVRSIPTDKESALAANKSLAEWNLAQKPRIDAIKILIFNLYDQLKELQTEVDHLKNQLDSISSSKSLDTTSSLMQVAAQEADDDAEALTTRFESGELSIDLFLKQFKEKKALAHLRKIKSDRLSALLREQTYSFAQTTSTPMPQSRLLRISNFVSTICWPTTLNVGLRLLCQSRNFATLRETVGEQNSKILYEPIFKDEREFPGYNTVNVQMQGCDFGSLEKYQAYVHKIANRFGFSVADSYAVAARAQKAITYKPYSTLSESETEIFVYHRVIRLTERMFQSVLQ
ncbi:unnamed protein product [Caenorhabditis sp. 36 PRJEB53466]|nr:unnamed protein product [Caenorhabditis sp. 36 PRJEB53466]